MLFHKSDTGLCYGRILLSFNLHSYYSNNQNQQIPNNHFRNRTVKSVAVHSKIYYFNYCINKIIDYYSYSLKNTANFIRNFWLVIIGSLVCE